ncbi:MAG: peptide-N-glycosidase F-related protein, partial [Bacteroidota bacterium]|nr:peptide-N-glycosidase F-related protein [Bacteroidota bacterium]
IGNNISSDLNLSTSANFEMSLDDSSFSNSLTVPSFEEIIVYVRFSPQTGAVGDQSGTLRIESSELDELSINLSGVGMSTSPVILSNRSNLVFSGDTPIFTNSYSIGIIVSGQFLTAPIDVTVSGPFKISLDGTIFSNNLQIPLESVNDDTTVYVHFSPFEVGSFSGSVILQSVAATDVEVTLAGIATPVVHNYTTYQSQPLGFGGGYNQSASQVFNLHQNLSNISQIKMFLQIDCPTTGCDDWDRFANIKVKDPVSGNWFEIGRYITPYWVGTQLLDRGLEFDVTDFKSLLTGTTELRIYIENWTTKTDLVSLEFDYIEGTPDYPFYAVSEVLGFHANSIDGVPYGVSHSEDLDRSVQIPNNAESSHLRTIISGWGHATPVDSNGRPCAEWCYRTHNVKINGSNSFQHYMGPIGCASNPIYNQAPGNWTPDRAGWCPGMAVPVRVDNLGTAFSGSSFTFEYDFEDWTSDGGTTSGQTGAYYATSTYVVVKSNTEISSPVVN